LFAKGPTDREVNVTVESSRTMLLKLGFKATCKRYDVAPSDAFQVSVNVIDTFFEPSAGERRVGVKGAATMVVKFHIVEYGLVPPTFVAFTRQ